jgi:hypothetical protein
LLQEVDKFLNLWKEDSIAHGPRVDRILRGVREDETDWVCLFHVEFSSFAMPYHIYTEEHDDTCIFAEQILQKQQLHSWQHRSRLVEGARQAF